MQNDLEIISVSSSFIVQFKSTMHTNLKKELCDFNGWAGYLHLPLFFARSIPRRAPKTITTMSKTKIRIAAIITVHLFTIVEDSFGSVSLDSNFVDGLSGSFFSGSNSIILP